MARCIRIQLEDLPQQARPVTTFVFAALAEFCAMPETFPVFQAWLADYIAAGDAATSVREAVAELTPGIIGGFGDFLAEGMAAERTP